MQPARFVAQFALDERDLLNDAASSLVSVPQEAGAAACELRSDFVYSLVHENPTLSDSEAWFNATAVTTAGLPRLTQCETCP